jgi:predicted alpha-1,2-mannosidase
MGGKRQFVAMLDSVFVVPPVFDDSYYGFPIHEIREMQIMNMGNYAHGNQPIQHMVYLYNYAGESYKTQYWVREILDRLYTPAPDGYCGDEDNGQTSAWYIFSAMGFYPVCPGTNQYVIGAPLFKKITVSLENGNSLTIRAPGNNEANRYVQSITLNGREWTGTWFDHAELMKGAVIDFLMIDSPQKQRLYKASDFPYSYSNEVKK